MKLDVGEVLGWLSQLFTLSLGTPQFPFLCAAALGPGLSLIPCWSPSSSLRGGDVAVSME